MTARKSSNLTVPDPLPEWFSRLSPDGFLGKDDMSKLFGVCAMTIESWTRAGSLPQPETAKALVERLGDRCSKQFHAPPVYHHGGKLRLKWQVGKVREAIAAARQGASS